MILLIDIGNSRIKIGLCKNPNIRNDINVFYCENINKINSELEKFDHYEFDAVLVSSVVPEINNKITQIIKDNLNITPTFINGDLIAIECYDFDKSFQKNYGYQNPDSLNISFNKKQLYSWINP